VFDWIDALAKYGATVLFVPFGLALWSEHKQRRQEDHDIRDSVGALALKLASEHMTRDQVEAADAKIHHRVDALADKIDEKASEINAKIDHNNTAAQARHDTLVNILVNQHR
jgi:hypothetical protein